MSPRVLLTALGLGAALLGSRCEAVVVIEEVSPGGAAQTAGLAAGDLLLAWERAATPPANPVPAAGRFESIYDLREVEIEQTPRGQVSVEVDRAGERLRVTIPPGQWRARGRPLLPAASRDQYLEALARAAAGEVTPALASLEDMASLSARNGDPVTASWLLLRAAELAQGSEQWSAAVGLREAARATVEPLSDPRLAAWVLEQTGSGWRTHNDLDQAAAAFRQALDRLGYPTTVSLAAASLLNKLAGVESDRGDVDTAFALSEQCLAVRETLAPGSAVVSAILSNLGLIASSRGDLADAEAFHRRALAVPESLMSTEQVAISLNNLAIVARDRGDAAEAEAVWLRALALFESVTPGGPGSAAVLNNLGIIAVDRDDPEAALDYLERSLAIRSRLDPDSLEVAQTLINLGRTAGRSGDIPAAERYLLQALEIQRRLAPTSMATAAISNNLWATSIARGDLDQAEQRLEEAWTIITQLAPESIYATDLVKEAAELKRLRGDREAAADLLRRAVALHEKLEPGTPRHAETLRQLAIVLKESGHVEEALAPLAQAADIMDGYRGRIRGGFELRGGGKEALYRELVNLLLELDRPEQAFAALERSRARGFLELLSERDLVFSADIPAELEHNGKRLALEGDRVLAALGGVSTPVPPRRDQRGIGGLAPTLDDTARRDELRRQLQGIRRRQDELRGLLRAASPKLHDLTYPTPLDLESARAILGQGTILLAYSLSAEASHLFVVTSDAPHGGGSDLSVHTLGCDRIALGATVDELRALVGKPTSGLAALDQASRRLSELLLAPAAETIASARRLIIVPDGPLHRLPFAALRDPASPQHYLVERTPVSVVASATVLGELIRARHSRDQHRVLAFGDPLYPARKANDQRHTSLVQRLYPIPATRDEVLSVGRIFGQAAELRLGAEATEEAVKAATSDASIIHLAAHALLDTQSPMDSAVALSIPSHRETTQDDGLLQVWEIFEQVRIDADLVTLSACDTALGAEESGEGLVGLTRAFQYAGARSVLASLWPVSDRSTARLMARFYEYLKDGTPKDEALRKAQIELLTTPVRATADEGAADLDARHPFFWAAFEIIGDWR